MTDFGNELSNHSGKNYENMGNFERKEGALEGVKGKGRGDVALGDDKIEDGRPQEL